MKKNASLEKAKLISRYASEKKGENIVLMDMKGISLMCDWFVLVSAASSRRINTISKSIQTELSKEHIKPMHVEGKQNPYWVLLDYADVVVHIFHKDVRDFYRLEELWSDAPRKRIRQE